MSYGNKIPDRWLQYSKIGNVVAGTNFIPFKVPLHISICDNLPAPARHTTRDVVEALPNIGLVISLTNTRSGAKYYQPDDWQLNGVQYIRIKVEGHVTPSQELLVRFCRIVKKFMLENPSEFVNTAKMCGIKEHGCILCLFTAKLIGIHCTHGLNRTGYFVCSYMVLVMSVAPSIALKQFAEARGYEIERENYIKSIISHEKNNYLMRAISQSRSRSRSRSNSHRRNANFSSRYNNNDDRRSETNYYRNRYAQQSYSNDSQYQSSLRSSRPMYRDRRSHFRENLPYQRRPFASHNKVWRPTRNTSNDNEFYER